MECMNVKKRKRLTIVSLDAPPSSSSILSEPPSLILLQMRWRTRLMKMTRRVTIVMTMPYMLDTPPYTMKFSLWTIDTSFLSLNFLTPKHTAARMGVLRQMMIMMKLLLSEDSFSTCSIASFPPKNHRAGPLRRRQSPSAASYVFSS